MAGQIEEGCWDTLMNQHVSSTPQVLTTDATRRTHARTHALTAVSSLILQRLTKPTGDDSMSPNDDKVQTLHQHASGASFRSTEQHKVTQVSQEQDVSDSQPADEASTLLSVATIGKAPKGIRLAGNE